MPHADDIRNQVKGLISEAHAKGDIRAKVVSHLAEQEVENRKNLILKGLAKRDERSREIQKMRPDTVTYTAEGAKQEVFSKDGFEKRKKAQEELEAIDKAIGKAMDEADYEPLKKITG